MIALETTTMSITVRDAGFPKQYLDLKLKHRRTMTGAPRIIKQQPCIRIHEIQISILSYEKYAEYAAFMHHAVGRKVEYTDFENQKRAVRIMTEPPTIAFAARFLFTTTLRLEELE